MSEIPFQVNEFRAYRVVRDGVSFGFIDTARGGYVPARGEELQYDGNTVILCDGREFTDAPQLRSAIREGWITPVGDEVVEYRPKSANIQVRPTETRGRDLPVKTTIETEHAEDTMVVSVEDRRRRRESTNAEATRRVPLESQEARVVMEAHWDSGDHEINKIASLIDDGMDLFDGVEPHDFGSGTLAQAEADILDMLEAVEGPSRQPRGSTTRQPHTRPPTQATKAPFRMPVEYSDARPSMPIVREDTTETGTVVGSVRDQQKTVVERETEFALDVARARPANKSPAPKPRFGGTGVVVHDEQRDMGQISLSSHAAPIKLEESAAVSSSGNETIRMGTSAQVGSHRKMATISPENDQGVAVGRILSPTRQSFVADSSNTSASAIQRTAEGGQPKVERYQVAPDQQVAKSSATGDVQEARSGDSLEDLLPDAAKPEPEVYRRPEKDPAYEAVRMLIPEFEWNKDRPVKERVADALKRIKEPMYVKGILAVETEFAREEIRKGLAALLKPKSKK